ncbi:hypothetical protein BJX62DRAFT_194559 [Aspergillus germanicus]
MAYYEPQGWQAPSSRQASWEQPVPPSRSGMFGLYRPDMFCLWHSIEANALAFQAQALFRSVTISPPSPLSLTVCIRPSLVLFSSLLAVYDLGRECIWLDPLDFAIYTLQIFR